MFPNRSEGVTEQTEVFSKNNRAPDNINTAHQRNENRSHPADPLDSEKDNKAYDGSHVIPKIISPSFP